MKSRKHKVSVNRRKRIRKRIFPAVYLAAVLFVLAFLGFLIHRDRIETVNMMPETDPVLSAAADRAGLQAAGNEKKEPAEQGTPVQAADSPAANGQEGGASGTGGAEQGGGRGASGTGGAEQAGGQDSAGTGGIGQTDGRESDRNDAGTDGARQSEGQDDPGNDEESLFVDEDNSDYYEMPETARDQDPVIIPGEINVPGEPEQVDDPQRDAQSDAVEGEPQENPEDNKSIEWSDNNNTDSKDRKSHFSTWENLLADLELPEIDIPFPWLRGDTEEEQDSANDPEAQSDSGEMADTPDGSDPSGQSQELPDPEEDARDAGGQEDGSPDPDPSRWPDLPSGDDQQLTQDPSGDDQTGIISDTESGTEPDPSEETSESFADDPYEETPGGADRDQSQDPSGSDGIEQPQESDEKDTSYSDWDKGTFLPEIP